MDVGLAPPDSLKSACMNLLGVWGAGLSIGFEVDGDILKADGYGGRRPPNKRGVWGRLTPPAGYRGKALLGVQGAKPLEAK